ncbi:glycosyltransferase [Thermanaerovibrio acidaminovorans]|uniref:glycosyltransferase n=1 Tax=Thermanaerovibrio acidaminovorans TaxID=81462 RepID=UPI003BF91123
MRILTDSLFSIVCVTYNQEDFIMDCLDSIAGQDYRKIELIVCDDCSTDRTVQVVEEWLEKHQDRFDNIVFLKNKENLGISATHDRGLRCAAGKYLKYIGGDDILAKNCVSRIVEFCKKTGTTWGQTLVTPFLDTLENSADFELPFRRTRKYFSYAPAGQFRMFARRNFFCAPGNFFERSILEEIGFLDTEFRTVEDWHTWLRLTRAGHTARLLPEPLVFWRRHLKSISYSAMYVGNVSFYQDIVRTLEKYVLPYEEALDWVTRKHLSSTLAYLKLLIEKGAKRDAHQKARWLLLKSPLCWMELHYHLLNNLLPMLDRRRATRL